MSTCPPPVWGEMAKWVGELRSADRGGGGWVGQIHWVQVKGFENPVLENNWATLNRRDQRERKKKKRRRVSGKKKKRFLQYLFFYSCVFFLPPSLYETLKPESSVAAALLFFQSCRLVHPVESCMKDTKEKKSTNDNSNNENLLYVGGNFQQSFLLWSFFLSFSLLANAFLFLFLSPLYGIYFYFLYPKTRWQSSGRYYISTKD